MIVSAEEAAQLAGEYIANGKKAVVLCPLDGGRWHIATLEPDRLNLSTGEPWISKKK